VTTGVEQMGRGGSWRIAGWGVAGLLLSLPLVAMKVGSGVEWDVSDFVMFGAMLLIAGTTVELGVRLSGDGWVRAGVGVAAATGFLLVWVNLAVGILRDEGNPANLMFAGVLAIACIASVRARLRSAGMARAMVATAGAQLLVGAIGLVGGWAAPGWAGVRDVVMGTGLFVALWLLAASLFRKAARGAL
jgi:hypothetical protein